MGSMHRVTQRRAPRQLQHQALLVSIGELPSAQPWPLLPVPQWPWDDAIQAQVLTWDVIHLQVVTLSGPGILKTKRKKLSLTAEVHLAATKSMRFPGFRALMLGRKAQWGSKYTTCRPDTKLGTSVRWYLQARWCWARYGVRGVGFRVWCTIWRLGFGAESGQSRGNGSCRSW